MSIPTLCLDGLILASASNPSGFSYSLYTQRRGPLREVTTAFLALLVLPYVLVGAFLWDIHPEWISFRSISLPLLALALLTVPVALLLEYAIHALASYRPGSRLIRKITIQSVWNRRLTPTEYLLLGLVVIGEEIFYRCVWLSILQHEFGVPLLIALGISSLAYGLNHLAFGTTTVLSKTVSGCLYGALYLLSGHNVLVPIITHCLQNIALFQIGKPKDA
ncbi:MAG: amino terminal protease family protein [Chthonomonadales bacterium]|nr:amino terminal protease family protein [Chthonomonadales bacterium]